MDIQNSIDTITNLIMDLPLPIKEETKQMHFDRFILFMSFLPSIDKDEYDYDILSIDDIVCLNNAIKIVRKVRK